MPQIPTNTFRYRYSQSYIPHGVYENLNFMESQSKTNLLSKKLHKTYEDVYRSQSHQQVNSGMCSLKQQLNGSIEPIYENVPLPRQDANANEMRDRASSIQSAPGIMRLKQQQQQQQQLQHQQLQQQHHQITDVHNFNRSIPHSIDRLSNDMHGSYPDANHRALSKTFSNPTGLNTIIHQQQQDNSLGHVSLLGQNKNSILNQLQPVETINQKTIAQITSMNRSNSANFLDSSHSSTHTNKTTASTTNSSMSSSTTIAKEKKKKRWRFFGGSKGSLSDKQSGSSSGGSLTLGRDKDKSTKSISNSVEDENNLRARWGLPRLPLPASISKEKLVSTLIYCLPCYLLMSRNLNTKRRRLEIQ